MSNTMSVACASAATATQNCALCPGCNVATAHRSPGAAATHPLEWPSDTVPVACVPFSAYALTRVNAPPCVATEPLLVTVMTARAGSLTVTDVGTVTVTTKPFELVGRPVCEGAGVALATDEADAGGDAAGLLAATPGLELAGTGPTVESDAVVCQEWTPTATATTKTTAARVLVAARTCRRWRTPATTASSRSGRGWGAAPASRRSASEMKGSRSSLMSPPSPWRVRFQAVAPAPQEPPASGRAHESSGSSPFRSSSRARRRPALRTCLRSGE